MSPCFFFLFPLPSFTGIAFEWVIYLHIFNKTVGRKEERKGFLMFFMGSLCFVPALSEWPFVIRGRITTFCWVEMMFRRKKMPSAFNRDAKILLLSSGNHTKNFIYNILGCFVYATTLFVFVCVWPCVCVWVWCRLCNWYIFIEHSLLWIFPMEKLSLVWYFVTTVQTFVVSHFL